MVSNNGTTGELAQLCESLSLPSTINPTIIEHLKWEYNSKKTKPSEKKYLYNLYIVLWVANQQDHQVASKSLKEHLKEMNLKDNFTSNPFAELIGAYLEPVKSHKNSDTYYRIHPEYML